LPAANAESFAHAEQFAFSLAVTEQHAHAGVRRRLYAL
jgi:hypothetical protein